ncbi:hypothetical protein [Acidovorax sp. Leaf160]|uniref:head-tail joining protein n=1 Tax=Acidovorax sp. Leaf160 TaxID=1736280 RepID=UPI0006F6F359|nr:hypothetical protein [Acidovorax sp. Leaf160]KQR55636.1 hypothetical protein ASF94_04320 [Acidovorax sp. Leaf160]
MSLAPFAAIEARVNGVAFARLANAQVSIAGGPAFGGIFEDAYATGAVGALGMASTQPVVVAPMALVPHESVGMQLVVNGTSYVIGAAEPDGAGAMRLLLENVL